MSEVCRHNARGVMMVSEGFLVMTWFEEVLARANELKLRDGVRGRYAPSPTGPLHMGNLRTALIAWLHCRLQQGQFILRIEDIDTPRVKPGSSAQIIEDLRWLGLDWDEGATEPTEDVPEGLSYTQSERVALYRDVLTQLGDRVYPCSCSRKDVMRAIEQSGASVVAGRALVYPGTCRGGMRELKGGRTPAYRLRVEGAGEVRFTDGFCGPQSQDIEREVGDVVLWRADGLCAYQLAVVVDDALMGVTDVVRGMDLLTSTPRQLLLFDILGAARPKCWHVPLMWDVDTGQKLSKRDGSMSLQQRRANERGLSAAQVIGELASSAGLIDGVRALSAAELLQELDFERFVRLMRRDVTRSRMVL